MAAPYLVNGMSGVLAAPIFVSGPNKLFDYAIFNAASATSFVSVYDSVLAPTVGTTVPKYQVGVSTLRSVHLAVQDVAGIYFKDGVWVAATTTAAGSSAPDTPVVVSLGMSTAAAPPSEAYALQVLADGASNYWRLGETSGLVAFDQIGGANGTISGGVTLNQPGALADGTTAMAFNGTTGKIVTAANVTIPVVATIEAWVKFVDDASYQPILALGSSQVPSLYIASNVPQFFDAAVGSNVTATTTITAGIWHHIVLTLNGAVGVFYIDGAFNQSSAYARVTPQTNVASLGNDPAFGAVPNGFWNGSLDEIAIYPSALTPAQIAAHYALRTVS